MENFKKTCQSWSNKELIKQYLDVVDELTELYDYIVFYHVNECDEDIQCSITKYNQKTEEKKAIENELSYRNIIILK